MAQGFEYKRRSAEEIKKRASASNREFAGILIDDAVAYKPKKDNWIRILPPTWDDPQHYGLEVYVHYSVGPENANVLCLRKMKNKKCPVCEEHARMVSRGETEEAKDIKVGKRFICYIVDMNETEKGVQIYNMPPTVDTDILKISTDRRTGEAYCIDSPTEGYDVFFDKTGEGKQGTKYDGFQLAKSPSKLSNKFLNYAIEHPVPEMLLWRDYNEVNDLFTGGVEEEQPPARRSGRPAPEDEAEPPVTRRRRDTVEEDEIPYDRYERKRASPEPDPEDAPPVTRRRVARQEPEPEEEAPPSPRRLQRVKPQEVEEAPLPARRRRDDPEEIVEEEPVRRQRVRQVEPEDEIAPPPRRRTVPDDYDEAPAEPPQRRRVAPQREPEEEPEPVAPRAALRQRLAQRPRSDD